MTETGPGRHFILTLGRSGSNYFVDIINQHPELLNYGEFLGPWTTPQRMTPGFLKRHRGRSDAMLGNAAVLHGAQVLRAWGRLRIGRSLELKRRDRLRSVGLKGFSLNLICFGLPTYLDERPDIRVIVLSRRDILDRLISARMLSASGVVKTLEGERHAAPQRLRLDPETLPADLVVIEAENAALAEMAGRLPGSRVLHLDYDACFASPEAQAGAAASIYAFLGASPFAPQARMRKIIRRPPSEVIEHWDECRRAVEGTRFAALFATLEGA